MPDNPEERLYKMASKAVVDWMELHAGETFDLDTICRHLEIHDAAKRKLVSIVLAYQVKHEKLEKLGRLYKVLSFNNNNTIDWINADDSEIFPLIWPASHDDPSSFLWDNIVVSPGDLIVLGGETNKGKTQFIFNLVWDNMDAFPVTLMGNAEYTASKFKRRTKNMTWANPLKEDGTPKFELIRVTEDWKYYLRPDNLCLIDWISLEGDFYRIGKLLEAMKSKMRKGVLVVSLQKGEGKTQAVGGHFTEDPADIYITLQQGHLTLKKVKEPRPGTLNLNGTIWAYELYGGTEFRDIRQVLKCGPCFGSGHRGSGNCEKCNGKGFIDKEASNG